MGLLEVKIKNNKNVDLMHLFENQILRSFFPDKTLLFI
jgi:hypothetical protein